MSLSQKLNKIFLIFFSKIFLEKPHLVYTYNLRYFVCTFIRLDWFAAQLSFLSWPWYWFIWKQTIFQTFKMSPSILFSFKNHPSPPLPLQLNVAMVGSRNVSCSVNRSEKSNPTLNIGRRGRKGNVLWKINFSKNICRRL